MLYRAYQTINLYVSEDVSNCHVVDLKDKENTGPSTEPCGTLSYYYTTLHA